jgi:hypothetical protein
MVDEPHFRAGDFSIEYLAEHPELLEPALSEEELAAAAVAAALLEDEQRLRHRTPRIASDGRGRMSEWRASGAPGRRDGWTRQSP